MENIRVTVGAIVLNERGEVLLAQRAHEPFKEKWCIPGGHVEFGEHPEHAVKRELQEETGLEMSSCSFFTYFNEYYKEMQWHAVALIFTGSASGILTPQAGEVKQLKFVKPEEVLQMDLAFNHRDIIQKYFFS